MVYKIVSEMKALAAHDEPISANKGSAMPSPSTSIEPPHQQNLFSIHGSNISTFSNQINPKPPVDVGLRVLVGHVQASVPRQGVRRGRSIDGNASRRQGGEPDECILGCVCIFGHSCRAIRCLRL